MIPKIKGLFCPFSLNANDLRRCGGDVCMRFEQCTLEKRLAADNLQALIDKDEIMERMKASRGK